MLYHGSKIAGIKELKPLPHNGVDGESVVFATTDIRFALAMIHGTGNELAVGYVVDQETLKEEMYIDELVQDTFKLMDAPGVLYAVKDSGFVTDSRLSHLELISKVDTKVIEEKYIPNIHEELKKYDIKFIKYEYVLEEMKKRKKDHKNLLIPYKTDRFN